jgi:hypothetical protein
MPSLQLHTAGLELPHPQFRSLHVGQNANRPLVFSLDRANGLNPRGVVGMRAVRKIQTEHIGARQE